MNNFPPPPSSLPSCHGWISGVTTNYNVWNIYDWAWIRTYRSSNLCGGSGDLSEGYLRFLVHPNVTVTFSIYD